jgi:hypothetical protein
MKRFKGNTPCPCGSGKKFKFCHGLNRPIPAPENIASIYFDEKVKKSIVVTKDILVNQLYRDGPEIARSFDRITRRDMLAMSAVLADSIGLIYRHAFDGSDEYQPTCARLLASTVSSFMASVEVARHGFRLPYGAMARTIIEALATILHIAKDSDGLQQFHAGKLQSTKAISSAKRILPPFGRLYGMLSAHFVHIGKAHAGLEPIVGYQKDEEPLGFIIASLKANSWLIYVVAELVFHNEVLTPRYWRYLGKGMFAFDPSETERAWQAEFLRGKIIEEA